MIRVYVELSGEAPALARGEAIAAAEAVGGRSEPDELPPLATVSVPDPSAVGALAARLGLARRCLVAVPPGESVERSAGIEGASGESAVFRRLDRGPGASDDTVRAAGRAYRDGGGRIDLEHPTRRYWLLRGAAGRDALLVEAAAVPRDESAARRMPLLPFQRPVSLPPRFARAAANLARVRAGDSLLDPFVGTGALLAEALLLGARGVGLDLDPAMIRGALRNLEHLGVVADRLVEGDAGRVDLGPDPATFDALVTDPPYGRASSSGGEPPSALTDRVLRRWADHLRPGGRIVLVAPPTTPGPPSPWTLDESYSVRVHRSLTREFRVYRRPD